ncbi:hypothetical protein B0H14DRAFT_3124125 [Mycena olivaceomarginata]|nr:hypothetical protein B0H14DRAFT_3124125 [Mycena olivaceomarginata]
MSAFQRRMLSSRFPTHLPDRQVLQQKLLTYFVKFIQWRLKSDPTLVKNELCELLAERAPHHNLESWASYWSRHHDLPDKILAAVRMTGGPEPRTGVQRNLCHDDPESEEEEGKRRSCRLTSTKRKNPALYDSDPDEVKKPNKRRHRSPVTKANIMFAATKRAESEQEEIQAVSPLLPPPPSVFAKDVYCAPVAPLILGAFVVMTFESGAVRHFGQATLQGDADDLVQFFKTVGGAKHLKYTQYLCTMLGKVAEGLHGADVDTSIPQKAESSTVQSSLGLVLERVDDPPRNLRRRDLTRRQRCDLGVPQGALLWENGVAADTEDDTNSRPPLKVLDALQILLRDVAQVLDNRTGETQGLTQSSRFSTSYLLLLTQNLSDFQLDQYISFIAQPSYAGVSIEEYRLVLVSYLAKLLDFFQVNGGLVLGE